MAGASFEFGACRLDAGSGRLVRDGEAVDLPDRHRVVLAHLLANAGEVISKDALIAAAWDVAVTDNSLEQVISSLRRALGPAADGRPWIETVPRRGYRFTGPVTRLADRATDDALEALLAPHRAFIEGRAALEALDAGRLDEARAAFAGAVAASPDEPAAHLGLANACLMRFETTRADRAPDVDALAAAARHAREACRLDPRSAEAWATLGLALDRSGASIDGLASLRRATALEPDNWRHHFRLASIGWGEERLRAARRTLALLPGFPLAHWLAATVHVAREAFGEAAADLDAGLAADRQAGPRPPAFRAVALHWLRGLLHLRDGDFDAADAAFAAELADADPRHLYAREAVANTWYAIAALRRRQGRPDDDVAAALEKALSHVPDHPLATAWARGVADLPHARAVRLVLDGRPVEAAALVADALDQAPPGSLLWLLPVEPVLAVHEAPETWAATLSRLRARAA